MGLVTALAVGATVAGSALAAKSQSKAAGKAADVSLQTAQENNALARENRDLLLRRADPFIGRGGQANALLADFYGMNAGAQGTPTPQPNALAQFNPGSVNPDSTGAQFGGGAMGVPGAFNPMLAYKFGNLMGDGGVQGRFSGQTPGYGSGTQMGQAPQGQQMNLPSSKNAFADFIANSDYAFQFGEGANTVNSGHAGNGTLQSGAAMQDLERFRQNLQSGYRGEWASGVNSLQNAGLGAFGAAAGVSTNFVNQTTANNNNAASAAANAALVRGANNPFANALGTLGGTILGSR